MEARKVYLKRCMRGLEARKQGLKQNWEQRARDMTPLFVGCVHRSPVMRIKRPNNEL